MATELPGKTVPICYDLNDLENIKEIFDDYGINKEKLDGLIYCAGVDAAWPVKVNSISAMQEVMNVNCFAFVEMSRIFYKKQYSNQNASIVAISSIASLTNEPGMIAYSVSKAALNSAVKTMSKEFIRRGIRVNAILPGAVKTPMSEKKEKVFSEIEKTEENKSNIQPLGVIPTDIIARQIKFLLSDDSGYTTGELITVSGGRNY